MKETQEEQSNKEEEVSHPPFFKSWRSVYLVVIGNLVLLVLLFYLFSVAY